MMEELCDDAPSGRHCFHDTYDRVDGSLSQVCCYCGDLFLHPSSLDNGAYACGEYEPERIPEDVAETLEGLLTAGTVEHAKALAWIRSARTKVR